MCGENAKNMFSNRQCNNIIQEKPSRCKDCILFKYGKIKLELHIHVPGDKLMKAVSEYNVEEVKSLLYQGVDPNYISQKDLLDPYKYSYKYGWTKKGHPIPAINFDFHNNP
uniref:Ankyrin repeat protein n=1 Tax=viral metagenome TaxID=1070528 RepID=A0A6C0J8N4_9ZZZZ